MIRAITGWLIVAALGITAAIAGAPAASADDAPPSVKAKVEALPWPALKEGDNRWEVMSAEFLLVDFGYLDVTEVDEEFDPRLTDAVKAYQRDKDLVDSGRINAQTWEHLRLDFDEIGPSPDSNLRTKAVQRALNEYGNDLVLDGYYGPATEAAVKEFQRDTGIDDDGWVGRITFRALICGGV